MIWFKWRRELNELYKQWCEKNDCFDSSFNVISFLAMEGLLDEDAVRLKIKELADHITAEAIADE